MLRPHRILVYLLLPFLAGLMASCASGPPDPVSRELYRGSYLSAEAALQAPDSLLVVSYNIAYARETSRFAQEFLAHPELRLADVLLLQEMDPDSTDHLARRLRMDHVYGPGYVHGRSGRRYGTAVLSRWPIIEAGGLVLPHANPFSDNHRRAVWADVDVGGRRVRAVSVHLSTPVISFSKRMNQVAALLDSLGTAPWATIIGGDFNTATRAEALDVRQAMRRGGFGQARLPAGPTVTHGGSWLLRDVPVLDHMFQRGLMPGATGLEKSFRSSDHLPVWVRYGWADP
jgi:endonuclease/exonuclease/phosphatase family metal-dependent hydrolase